MYLFLNKLNAKIFKHQREVVLATVVIPAASFFLALTFLWKYINTVDILSFFIMGFLVITGITVGYHRFFAHKSFEASRPIKIILAILGSMAVQGPVLYWVAVHRKHHRYSDIPGDPHSPNLYGDSFRQKSKGFFHAHIGWIFTTSPGSWVLEYIPDLAKDRDIVIISSLYYVWVLLGLALPAIIVGILMQSWWLTFSVFIWGGLVRVFVTNHITYSINSVCHLFGTRAFLTKENSRNNYICAILALGEGWHNNHHAFPRSAKFGIEKSQPDIGYWIILLLQKINLIKNVQTPTLEERKKKLLKD